MEIWVVTLTFDDMSIPCVSAYTTRELAVQGLTAIINEDTADLAPDDSGEWVTKPTENTTRCLEELEGLHKMGGSIRLDEWCMATLQAVLVRDVNMGSN